MYLEGTEAKEALLLQRLHDLARQDVCSLIEKKEIEQNHQTFSINFNSDKSSLDSNKQLGKSRAKSLVDLSKIEPYKDEELW